MMCVMVDLGFEELYTFTGCLGGGEGREEGGGGEEANGRNIDRMREIQ